MVERERAIERTRTREQEKEIIRCVFSQSELSSLPFVRALDLPTGFLSFECTDSASWRGQHHRFSSSPSFPFPSLLLSLPLRTPRLFCRAFSLARHVFFPSLTPPPSLSPFLFILDYLSSSLLLVSSFFLKAVNQTGRSTSSSVRLAHVCSYVRTYTRRSSEFGTFSVHQVNVPRAS